MEEEANAGVGETIDGLSEAEAVEVVLAREGSPGAGTVRTALERVADDGVVSWAAADEALAHASKVVSTPETRVELASIALAEAKEAAEPATDLDVVRSRVRDLEDRLSALEDAVEELAGSLQAVVRRCEEREDLYAVARGLRDVTADANRLHGAAEDLKLDVEAFERWLGNHGVRVRELEEDVDAVASSLEELADAVGRLEEAVGDGTTEGTSGAVTAADPEGDPSTAWVDASLRRRTMDLLVADLRAELDGLRVLANRSDVGPSSRTDHVEGRLDTLDARITAIGRRLEDVASATWRERYGDRLAAFETAVDEFEPPVDWGQVETALEERRAAIDGVQRSGSAGSS